MASFFKRVFGKNSPSQSRQVSSYLEHPWRDIVGKGRAARWDDEMEKNLRMKCLDHNLELGGEQVRILIMGATGSGKSSFINSLYAALTDEVQDYTFAAGPGGRSVTKKIFNPLLRVRGKEPYFRILDSPGLMESDDKFFQEFVEHALRGHLKENVEYEPLQIPKDGKKFIAKPGKLERPCLVVFVLKPEEMRDGPIKQKLEMAKDLASRNGIKLIVVLTNADLATFEEKYPLKNADTQYIFNSKAILEVVNMSSGNTGLPQNRIFPVTNYVEQTETCTEMNIVLLYTLSKLLADAKLEAASRLAERGQEEED